MTGVSGVWIVTGVSASGKTTVAGLLADRFERSVLIEGDALRAVVRRGERLMTPDLDPEGSCRRRARRLAV